MIPDRSILVPRSSPDYKVKDNVKLINIKELSASIAFFFALLLFLGTAAYFSTELLREDYQKRAHLLNAQLLSEQIDHLLKVRLRVVKAVAGSRLVKNVLAGKENPQSAKIRLLLNTAKDVSHSDIIYIINNRGIAISSTDIKGFSLIGYDYAFRPYFRHAMAGKVAIFPALGAVTKIRGLHLSAPIYDDSGQSILGVATLKINIDTIEELLKKRKGRTVLISPDSVIFSSNYPEWLYHSFEKISPQVLQQLGRTKQFGDHKIRLLNLDLSKDSVKLEGEKYFVAQTPLPISGWRILSLEKENRAIPLPPFYSYILSIALGVTFCLATLVFYLWKNIRHRNKVKIMLQYAEQRYSDIVKNAVMGIFQSTPEGKFVDANPAMAALLDFQNPDQLINAVGSIGEEIYTDPKNRELFYQILQDNRQVSNFETQLFRRDGKAIWVSLSGRIAYKPESEDRYLEGFCMDISDKRAAEEALQRERDIFSLVMQTSPVGIVMIDSGMEITFANPRAEEILTLEPSGAESPVYRKPVWRIKNADGSEIEKEDLPAIKLATTRGLVRNKRIGLEWPDGRLVVISLNMAPVYDHSGNIESIVAAFQDISEKIKQEKDAALRQEQLFLADRMAAMGVLTSGVAHEINNPNTFIHSNAQMLADSWREASIILDEYYNENGEFFIGGLPYTRFRETLPGICSHILEGSQRITRIIKELRDYSRNESTELTISVDINKVIKSAQILLSNMIKKSTHNFVLDLAEDIPPIRGYFQRLEQVVVNLVQNSCQALPEEKSGIFISTHCDRVNGKVVLICRDEGIGILRQDLKRVMDPFFTTKRDSGGTGLGLAISSTIVRELNGKIELQSEPGKGTTVTLEFPVGDQAAGDESK